MRGLGVALRDHLQGVGDSHRAEARVEDGNGGGEDGAAADGVKTLAEARADRQRAAFGAVIALTADERPGVGAELGDPLGRHAELVDHGLGIGAIKLNPDDPFQWASGYRMPIYNDNRMFLFHPEMRRTIAKGLAQIVEEKGIRLVFVMISDDVRAELDRFGITDLVGEDAFYATGKALLDAYHERKD